MKLWESINLVDNSWNEIVNEKLSPKDEELRKKSKQFMLSSDDKIYLWICFDAFSNIFKIRDAFNILLFYFSFAITIPY